MESAVYRSLRHWWVFLLRGILFIGAAIYMIFSPTIGYTGLGFIFGFVIFLASIAELLRIARGSDAANRTRHLMLGVIDLAIAVILMQYIGKNVAILRLMVGIWFLIGSISLFDFSLIVGKSVLLGLVAVITAIVGLFIIFDAAFSSVTILVFTTIAFIITGLFYSWLGYSMKPD
jgi:uncharacterized membrane protein HdeD (DUF308 family)